MFFKLWKKLQLFFVNIAKKLFDIYLFIALPVEEWNFKRRLRKLSKKNAKRRNR